MGRDSENEGGSLIGMWARFNLSNRFRGSHSLVCGMGVQVESNHQVGGDINVIIAVGTPGLVCGRDLLSFGVPREVVPLWF
jgi:hypothetical protein